MDRLNRHMYGRAVIRPGTARTFAGKGYLHADLSRSTKKPSRRTGSAPSAKRIPPGMCRRIRPVLSISSKPLNATIPVFMPRA
jgi:hypothetical protein